MGALGQRVRFLIYGEKKQVQAGAVHDEEDAGSGSNRRGQ